MVIYRKFNGTRSKIARRRRVSIAVARSADPIAEVAVRFGYPGYPNRDHAERIHAAIAQRLDG